MSRYTKKLVKVSSALGVLLSFTTLSTAKATAIGIQELIPLGLEQLQDRSIKVNPSAKLLEESFNENKLQICVLPCPLPDASSSLLSLPSRLIPQTQTPEVPLSPRSNLDR